VSTMRAVKVLLTSADPSAIEMMRLAVAGIERRVGERLEFISARNGEEGLKAAWRERPEVVVADEIASRAGAFAMARDLRGAQEPFEGMIVILLDRPHDRWLAKWSGADAWFVKPVDPFSLADRVLELLEKKLPGPGRDAAAVGTRPSAGVVDGSMKEGM
jgi:DNA-binding response OmpR family regulator